MALGRQGDRQGDLVVTWREMPRSPGHVFYDRLQGVLIEAGFDALAEATCKPYYAAKMGAPSVPLGRYFRMHMVGYFEGIDSERGIEWRCADSLSLREFLRLQTTERVPDHSWLSKTRSRLPHEVHQRVFGWVLTLIAERGLVKGDRIGVDASTMEANAALRTIVRRDSGETYREMLKRMAKESGIETPSADDLIRLDRGRKGKKLSNEDWVSGTDAEAKVAKMKDGTTHLAYKPEHAVDLDTGAVVAAEIHPADEGDTTTLPGTLKAAAANLADVGMAPTEAGPAAATSGELAALTENTSRLFSPAQLRTAISTVSNPLDVGFAKTTQDIIDCIAAGKKVVNIAAGTFDISTTLALPSLIRIVGAGPGNTILNWVGGAAPAIDSATPTTRTYSTSISNLTVQNSGSGTVGINWSAISSGRLSDLLVIGFATQYALVGSNGYCVYNRLRDCVAQGGTCGFLIGGTGSNANSLIGCRGNAISGWCVDIAASNGNLVQGCQFESSTAGVRVRSDSVADGDGTIICFNRFESINGGSGGIAIQVAGANTRTAQLILNHILGTGGAISDAGTRTIIMSMGDGSGAVMNLATPYANPGGAYRLTRTAASTDVPMLVLSDTAAGSGAPVTLEINTERAGGVFLRGKRGGTTYAQIRADGKGLFTGGIGVGNSVTAASMGALSRRVQVFDENGNPLGYMPIYVS